MKLENRVFVVSGGGNGLGRELVLKLISSGGRVAAVDIDQAGLDETEKLLGEDSDQLSKHIVDITDRDAVSALPALVIDKHGKVDAVINNAGVIQPFIKIKDMGYQDIERVMNINFFGAVNMTKAFLPNLFERPEAYIVNISSMGGFLPVPGQGIYGASKAALKLFTEALYAELSNTDIRVMVVFPGGMQTDIAARSGAVINMDRVDQGGNAFLKPMSPKEAANIIVAGIEKERFRIVVGTDSKFMNVLYRLSPKFATNFIAKQMESLLEG